MTNVSYTRAHQNGWAEVSTDNWLYCMGGRRVGSVQKQEKGWLYYCARVGSDFSMSLDRAKAQVEYAHKHAKWNVD